MTWWDSELLVDAAKQLGIFGLGAVLMIKKKLNGEFAAANELSCTLPKTAFLMLIGVLDEASMARSRRRKWFGQVHRKLPEGARAMRVPGGAR